MFTQEFDDQGGGEGRWDTFLIIHNVNPAILLNSNIDLCIRKIILLNHLPLWICSIVVFKMSCRVSLSYIIIVHLWGGFFGLFFLPQPVLHVCSQI